MFVERESDGVPRSTPEQIEYVSQSWPADAGQLSRVRRAMRAWLAPLTLDETDVADIVLAVDEAVANAIEHAYAPDEAGTVELLFWTEPGQLSLEVIDHGRWKPPSTAASYRGRGMQVMQVVMDAVLIHYDRRGTRVLLRHTL